MNLLKPIDLAGLSLKNKSVMAAMTRSRANVEGVVGEMTVEYYRQRVSAGLILTEAINISEDAIGSPFTPGLYTAEQIEAWKKVTETVHANGGKIFAQLWHTGRAGHSVDRKGVLPVAPSAIAIEGAQHFTSQGPKAYEIPRALSTEEVKATIQQYGVAAKNAIEAGFDGVELHGANGYLPMQFLAENSNKRTDEYGGSIENNCRFMLETMKVLIDAVGGNRVGVKLSPFHVYNNTVLNDPMATFTYLIEELNALDFAFIELMKRSPMFPSPSHYPVGDELELLGSLSKNTVIANGGYLKDSAEAELEKGIAKLISFGATFLANPDLLHRFELDAPLNQADRATMFGGAAAGYIDYPTLNQA